MPPTLSRPAVPPRAAFATNGERLLTLLPLLLLLLAGVAGLATRRAPPAPATGGWSVATPLVGLSVAGAFYGFR